MANEKLALDLYYKLHKCLKIALTAPAQPNGDDLSCHANNIICYLAKSIENNMKWYEPTVDIWCNYFLDTYKRNNPDAEQLP